MAKGRAAWIAVAVGGAALGFYGIGVAVSRSKRRSAEEQVNQRISLIGDSYAVGLGPELAKIFPNLKYEGHVGSPTTAWAHHSASCGECGDWLPAFKPDVVLVSLGTNDAAPKAADYQTLVRGLHGLGARVVWIEPPAGVDTAGIHVVRPIITSLGVQTVPPYSAPLGPDRLHPDAVGYKLWAHSIASAVAPLWVRCRGGVCQ